MGIMLKFKILITLIVCIWASSNPIRALKKQISKKDKIIEELTKKVQKQKKEISQKVMKANSNCFPMKNMESLQKLICPSRYSLTFTNPLQQEIKLGNVPIKPLSSYTQDMRLGDLTISDQNSNEFLKIKFSAKRKVTNRIKRSSFNREDYLMAKKIATEVTRLQL